MAVTVGPSGKQLDFSYQARNTLAMLNELGRLLINVCNIVPAGIVCFFPSYEYEKLVFQHLERSGVIAKVALKKKIFREPKKASNVDEVLSEYSTTINGSKCTQDKNSCNGALLFSVVGGKLSEGLNFSDDLGRCVILVGLPYPNMKSPELQEKINYLNTKKPGSGKLHYENLCMKAVNQSIGRAVRHKDDYSTVLLLDQRYSQPHIQAALPSWIRPSVQTQVKFGPMLGQLVKRGVALGGGGGAGDVPLPITKTCHTHFHSRDGAENKRRVTGLYVNRVTAPWRMAELSAEHGWGRSLPPFTTISQYYTPPRTGPSR
uniref:ATP-dependent helicase C-terminal domain-containing protein n=1 Tax=Timema cristinae TaxID=61476 RepID=A0A7R9CBJ6_TIMCR|nr:unnamed protein product [Timema cristinae]